MIHFAVNELSWGPFLCFQKEPKRSHFVLKLALGGAFADFPLFNLHVFHSKRSAHSPRLCKTDSPSKARLFGCLFSSFFRFGHQIRARRSDSAPQPRIRSHLSGQQASGHSNRPVSKWAQWAPNEFINNCLRFCLAARASLAPKEQHGRLFAAPLSSKEAPPEARLKSLVLLRRKKGEKTTKKPKNTTQTKHKRRAESLCQKPFDRRIIKRRDARSAR